MLINKNDGRTKIFVESHLSYLSRNYNGSKSYLSLAMGRRAKEYVGTVKLKHLQTHVARNLRCGQALFVADNG